MSKYFESNACVSAPDVDSQRMEVVSDLTDMAIWNVQVLEYIICTIYLILDKS